MARSQTPHSQQDTSNGTPVPSSSPEIRSLSEPQFRALSDLVERYSGWTMDEVGKAYNISRERVRQILSKADVSVKMAIESRKLNNIELKAHKKDLWCLGRFGCYYSDYKMLIEIGRDMMSKGYSREVTPTRAFTSQARNSKIRKIPWRLTLWQWWKIWEESGKYNQRGRGNGYVMARYGDEGAYEVGNVLIISVRRNTSDGNKKNSNLPIGVSREKNKFRANVMMNTEIIRLGAFDSIEEASSAYQKFISDHDLIL